MSNIYTRHVPIGVLLEFGFSEQEAKQVSGGQPTVAWAELAKHDGISAIRALTEEEHDRLIDYLDADAKAVGVALDRSNRNTIPAHVWAGAQTFLPPVGNPFYSYELHSAVGCALLLGLVAEAFGKSKDELAAERTKSFAAQLGVAA